MSSRHLTRSAGDPAETGDRVRLTWFRAPAGETDPAVVGTLVGSSRAGGLILRAERERWDRASGTRLPPDEVLVEARGWDLLEVLRRDG